MVFGAEYYLKISFWASLRAEQIRKPSLLNTAHISCPMHAIFYFKNLEFKQIKPKKGKYSDFSLKCFTKG